jgi:hypothetical protein
VELTPLRGPKIAAFLMAGIGSTACSIYKAAQFTRKPLGRSSPPSHATINQRSNIMLVDTAFPSKLKQGWYTLWFVRR